MLGAYKLLLLITYVYCKFPDGYTINSADGHGYKLMYTAETWEKARDGCTADGAKLAVPKSERKISPYFYDTDYFSGLGRGDEIHFKIEDQFKFIQKLVRNMHYPSIVDGDYKLLAWLGINNMEEYTVWKNVDGENIIDTGYHVWAGHNGHSVSDDPAEPHCVGLDGVNSGLREYWCRRKQPYICEIDAQLQ